MISFVVALYNEEDRISDRLKAMCRCLESLSEDWELLLVDDGSTDGTWPLLESFARADGRVRALRGGRNMGQGAALKLGVLASRGDVVAYSDADLSVSLARLGDFVGRLRAGADVVIASRWMKGATITVEQPRLRRALGKAYYWVVHRILLPDVHDTNCGFKAYRGEAARILFGLARAQRWAFNVEHLWLARRLGFRVEEVPVEWSHRDASKVQLFRDCLVTLWEIAGILARERWGRYPRAVITRREAAAPAPQASRR